MKTPEINQTIKEGASVLKKCKEKSRAKNGNTQGVNPLGRQNGKRVLLYPRVFKVLTPYSLLHAEKVNLSPFTSRVVYGGVDLI